MGADETAGGPDRPAAGHPTPSPHTSEELARLTRRALAGNLAKAGEKLRAQNKLFVRDRLSLLLDAGSFVEDGLLANNRPRTCRPTASSPVSGASRAGRCAWSPTTRR